MSQHATAEISSAGETLTTYADAVNRGDYDTHVGNLTGKHDNVRSYWEDQLTRLTLRPHLATLVDRKVDTGEKIRIADLGCGAGQGYELLTKINRRDLDLGLEHQHVLDSSDIDCYLGVDLSQSMVDRGNQLYADDPTIRFVQGNLNKGLCAVATERPFDLYFCAYGSLSHIQSDALMQLLLETVDHAANGSLIVLDLLGRNSLEWPGYWDVDAETEPYFDYSMSYLHRNVNNEIAPDVDVEHFPMRYWTGDEIDRLLQTVNSNLTTVDRVEAGAQLTLRTKFDRSIFIGRHIDTGEYNTKLRPMRRVINRLHEDYLRTDLDQLFWQPQFIPTHADEEVNTFFHELMMSWNTVVNFTQERLQKNVSLPNMSGWDEFPAPLQFALMTMDRVINSVEWMWYGDPRANIIEPQLGYALRSLEFNLQRGLGCGHGLVAILEVQK